MIDPHLPMSGRILGIDWGTSRIGLALSDETQLIATPLGTLRRRAGKRLPLHDFLTRIESERPVGLVIGIPFDDYGQEGDSAIHARVMGSLFAERSGLPVAWVDESFTTVEANDALQESGKKRSKRVYEIDAVAAAVTLRRWLERRRQQRSGV